MRETLAQDARWTLFFARTGIVPLRLVYEDALSAADATVAAIARLVGVEGPVLAAPERIAVAVQRDGQSADWRKRFVAEHGDRDAIDAALGA